MPKNKRLEHQLMVRVGTPLMQELEEVARDEHRTVASLCRAVLIEFAAARAVQRAAAGATGTA